MINFFKFAELCGKIKRVKRAGWLRYLPPQQVESVADHSHRVATLCFSLPTTLGVDRDRCLKMALIHDIAEGIIGDFTPHDKITAEEKHCKERDAFLEIVEPLDKAAKEEAFGLWMEYEKGCSLQAKVVKDLDKIEMLIQAKEYEQRFKQDLQQFFTSTVNKLGPLKSYGEELMSMRE